MDNKRYKRRNRNNLIQKLAEFKIRLSRGQGIFYELRNALLMGASLKVIFDLRISETAFTTLILLSFFYFVGKFF